jgi:hypothetical protein
MKGVITGVVKYVSPIQSREYNGKTFESRTFIVETSRNGENPKYAKANDKLQTLKFECGFNMINDIEQHLNSTCNVMYQLSGNAYVNKTTGEPDCFNKLYCSGIAPLDSHPHSKAEAVETEEDPF